MLKTRFTELVGCSVPLQQAPIGVLATPRLAAAVADAGGLGMTIGTLLPPSALAKRLDDLRAQTRGVFGVNFIPDLMSRDSVWESVEIAATRARVIDFFFGSPEAALVEIVHKGGGLACWQVGSKEEAMVAAEAGCDLIVAQGIEAGGHIRSHHTGLLALLSQVLDSVHVPVLAAGGIGTGRAMAAALAAGASGVRVGTRFVAAEEAEAHPAYVTALVAAEAGDTVFTDRFSGGWPDAPHRVLRSCLEAAEAFQGEVVGELFNVVTGTNVPLRRFQGNFTASKRVTGTIEAMPLWAGESVIGVRGVQPAAEIVYELSGAAEELLRRWGSFGHD